MILSNVCFGSHLVRRRSVRLDGGNDLMILQNCYSDNDPVIILRPRCERFKLSFIYRAVCNYNNVRKIIDLDQFPFKRMQKFLELFHVNDSGIFIELH